MLHFVFFIIYVVMNLKARCVASSDEICSSSFAYAVVIRVSEMSLAV